MKQQLNMIAGGDKGKDSNVKDVMGKLLKQELDTQEHQFEIHKEQLVSELKNRDSEIAKLQ